MNKAVNMDCVEYMRTLPNDLIDLTITSPPYDNIREYHGFIFDYEATISELFRITKPGGVVVWIVSDQTVDGSETGTSFRQALFAKEVGFNLHDTMIWRKETCAFPEATRYYPVFEYMFIFSKGKPKTYNPIKDRKNIWGGQKVHGTFRQADGTLRPRSATWKESVCLEYGVRYNVWDVPTEKNNRTGHPAVFPIALVKDHIITWSNEGDVVFDPFLGSGTTRIAAWELNRQFLGSEIDKTYFDAEEKRFKEITAQIRLF